MLRKEKSSPQTFGENAHEELSNKKCDMRGGLPRSKREDCHAERQNFLGNFPKVGA